MYPKKNSYGELVFKDYPDFRPTLTPQEIFTWGAFGGTYYRDLKSKLTGRNLSKNDYKKYTFLKNIPMDMMGRPWKEYDTEINRYGVRVGTTYQYWIDRGWIDDSAERGWNDWYVNFYKGKRTHDDERQISRWKGVRGRFGNRLQNMMDRTGKAPEELSPKISQTLHHWGIDPDML